MEDEQQITKRQSTFPLFSKHFKTHPQDVLDHFTAMRKQMEDFIDAFRKRIDVEITYAKNLQSVSKALDKYIKPGTELATSYICSAFKVQHEQRSRQAQELAESLKTEIQTMCSEYLKTETAAIKKMEKDLKRLYKQAQSYSENHSEALQKFQSINREMEQTIITKSIMRYTTGIPQDKKVKMIAKASDTIKQNKQYQKLYLSSVRDYNAFMNAYQKYCDFNIRQIITQLDQTQSMVRQQVILQGDCLRKLIVAQVSMFKNIQYDLLNISKQMEYLDTQKQVEIFVEQQKNNQVNRILKEQKKEPENQPKRMSTAAYIQIANNDVITEKPVLGKSMLSESILYVEEEYFSWMLSNKRNKTLRDLIGHVWRKYNNQKQEGETGNAEQSVAVKEGKESGKQQEPVNVEQTAEPKVQTQTVSEQKSWQDELKQLIATFKIQQPPNLLNPSQKKKQVPTQDKIFLNFVQIIQTISLIWNSQQSESQLITSKLNEFQIILSQHHLYRLIALMFVQEYRLQHQVIIRSSSHARMCGRVVKVLLRESLKRSDVFVMRGLLGLIFTFYWNQDKVKKLIYQSPEIYQAETWKRLDFWEAAIFQTTYQQMALFAIQKGETAAETKLREKNLIFSQLASYCHYMIMLGTTSKNVRLTVGRYCRLHQMTQQQNKDLSKMITNTAKQFKDINGKAMEREKSVIGD